MSLVSVAKVFCGQALATLDLSPPPEQALVSRGGNDVGYRKVDANG